MMRQTKTGTHPATDPSARLPGWSIALIFILTWAIYSPAVNGEFLWDDRPGHVTRPELQSMAGLGRIWFEIGATQQYYPVLHTAFWLEHRLWGDSTPGYHVINILLHATAACLFGAVLRRMSVPGATLAAMLFAVHPVCVESVAWITEQKNTLSAVFFLAAGLAYIRFEERRSRSTYFVATILFLLALLTKTVTASLPAAILLIAWWRRGRISWRDDVQPLLPWFAFALAGGLLTAWFESTLIGAHGPEFSRSVIERCLLPARVIWFYFGKLIWPGNLAFIYPRWRIDATDILAYLYSAALLGVFTALWLNRRRARGPLTAALFFAGTLFPVLGFFNVYPFRYSFVADHFQYLACLGPFTAAAFGLAQAFPFRRPYAAVVVAGALALLAWSQSGMYRDTLTLYQTTLARNPDSWMAHNNLAEALAARGRPAEAVPHLESALKLKPDSAESENNLGDDLRQLGRAEEAIPHLQRALVLQPAYPEAHNNLGVAKLALGRAAEGRAEIEQALRLKPNFPLARYNLGLAYANAGDLPQAAANFRQAVALKPDYAEAELNWGIALLLSEGFGAASPHFQRALQLDPGSAEAHHAHGRALAQARQGDEAVAEFQEALRLNPNRADVHYNFSLTLRQLGRTDEANAELQEATRLRGGR